MAVRKRGNSWQTYWKADGRQWCRSFRSEGEARAFDKERQQYARRSAGPTERFWAKVDKGDDCWIWRGHITDRGYGFWRHPELGRHPAHRIAWMLDHGPVPGGLVLDHLCRVTACVRPDHLEPVTPGENSRRMWRDNPMMGSRLAAARRREAQVEAERDWRTAGRPVPFADWIEARGL